MEKMKDVGETRSEVTAVEALENKHYPTLYLSTKQLPELKGKEPGDKGILSVEYEVRGYSIRSVKGQKGEEGQYDIEIQKIGVSKKAVEAEDKEKDEEKETEEIKKDVKERLKAGRSY